MNAAGRTPFEPRVSGRLMVAFAAVAALPVLVLTVLLVSNAGQAADALVGSSLALALLAAVLAVLVGRIVTYRIDRALWQLLRAARRLATGDYAHLIEVDATPEIRGLASELERIGIRLEALQGALDDLELASGVEIGRRSSEVQRYRTDVERLDAEARAFHQFAAAINRTVDPAQICSQLVANAEGTVDYVWAVAGLVDPAANRLVPVFVADRERKVRQVGHHLHQLKELAELPDLGERSCAAWAVQTKRTLIIGDGRDERWREALREGLASLLVVPLVAKDQVLGVVELGHGEPAAYGEKEERFLVQLADQAAMAIANARLLEEAAKVEALRELDRLKSELLSTVTHELRTPLVSIKGYAETLLRNDVTWSDEERHEFLLAIDEESKRLQGLIDDLLQMSQIEAGKLKISRQAVAVPRLAQRVARKVRLSAHEHTISVSFPGDLPLADADPKRVEQVLANLIQNAVKYSPEGGAIRVRGFAATARRDTYDIPGDNPDHIVVAVADEGVGISAEHLPLIFDRFYRVDGELSRQTGGSGLGLAISKGIVEAHGGRIWVESPGTTFRAGEAGKGSTFYFSLPIRTAAAEELEAVGVGGGEAQVVEDE